MIHLKGKIPVIIRPMFWLTAILIGFLNSGTLMGTAIWIFVIFFSVLIHEFGHASTALFFGLSPHIELVFLGGITYHQGEKLSYPKQFLIVFNGPLFGFLLFLLAWVLLKIPFFASGVSNSILTLFYWVNLIWTVLNLIPVMPLDGGQLLRIAMEAFFGAKGFRYSLMVGMIIAGGASLVFFLFQNFLVGALFFLFAFQSWDAFRKLKRLSNEDQNSDLKDLFASAEKELQEGHKDKALFAFERLHHDAKEGMIFLLSTQYLAFLKYEMGKKKEAYDLLNPLRTELSPEALCLLHQVAYEEQDYSLVEEISGACFQAMPSQEVALRSAYATAALEKPKPCVGWLETAFQEGLENISDIAKRKEFDPVRENEYFEKFLKHHS